MLSLKFFSKLPPTPRVVHFLLTRQLRRGVRQLDRPQDAKRSDDDVEPIIQVVEEKVDLKSDPKVPASVRMALENDPQLTELNENLHKRRRLKFTFDPQRALDQLNECEPQKVITVDDLELAEEPSVPKSRSNCPGCGARLHCQDKHVEGFIPADVFKVLAKHEMHYKLCYRCEILNSKGKLLNVDAVNQFDYNKFVVKRICAEPKAHVILLIDLLDIPNSIYDGWSALINKPDDPNSQEPKKRSGNNLDIVIVGNKFDLLPCTGPLFTKSIVECLLHHCAAKGIQGEQIKSVELISAKTGFNVERLVSRLFKIWNDEGNVYLLGMANAGKSVLFNQLLGSDYCRSLASEAMVRATTSFWPGTTLNMLKFPITFLADNKKSKRTRRLFKDADEFDKLDTERTKLYQKTKNLKFAEAVGLVGSTFKPFSPLDIDQIDANVDATYSMNSETGKIDEGVNFGGPSDIQKKRVEDARRIFKPYLFNSTSAWFYDTPGILGSQEILRYFSRKELEIVSPMGLIMPRVYWMVPGQTLFVGGLIRIDLLESTKNERVLFTIMASPALPIVNPFPTPQAESLYQEYYEKGNVLRVPHKEHIREKPLPSLESKNFEVDCIGNFKSTADIVFNCFGWSAVTSRPETKALVRAWTLGGRGLELRQPSLLPFIVNMRKKWSRIDDSQAFKSVFYRKPKK